MGLFNFFKHNVSSSASGSPIATAENIAQVSYEIAYYGLPNWINKEFERFLGNWRDLGAQFGATLCKHGCSRLNVHPTQAQLDGFKNQDGHLTSFCQYYLFQFPKPRPYPLTMDQLKSSVAKTQKPPVLAPFFAVALRDQSTSERTYFVLGQSLLGENQTTLRTVDAEGINYNLGPGPEPSVAAFLSSMKSKISVE